MDPESDPQPNLELLDKVVAHIEAAPEGWNQGVWRQVITVGGLTRLLPTPCGTAMCFAGEAVELTQPRYVITREHIAAGQTDKDMAILCRLYAEYVYTDDPAENGAHRLTLPTRLAPEGKHWVVRVNRRAITVLGLTELEADILFSGQNTWPCLKDLVDALKDGVRNEGLLPVWEDAMDLPWDQRERLDYAPAGEL